MRHQKPERLLLEAVALLHDQGQGRLRIAPYLYATGHWRIEFVPADAIDPSHGALIQNFETETETYRYSEAMGTDLFGDGAEHADPGEVARALRRQLPRLISASAGHDEAYVSWYAEMLSLTGDDALPYAFSDYEEPIQQLYVQGPTPSGISRIPAPPPVPR